MNRKRRTIGTIVACILVISLVAGVTYISKGAKKVLHVYNAGEYMDLSLLEEFQKQYNCQVVMKPLSPMK